MTFVVPTRGPKGSATPEALFRDLARGVGGPAHLWAHQADLLREYAARHVSAPDVAIELPTGAGKTLVGMLIAEWRRRERDERVAYVCPTRQLARQATVHGREYGVPVVTLVGPSARWNAADVSRYRRNQAVAITTYKALFNTNSRLGDAHLLLFDDAHAASSFVAPTWSVQLADSDPLYSAVLRLLADGLPSGAAERLIEGQVDLRDRRVAHLVSPHVVRAQAEELTRLLSEQLTPGSEAWFGWQMVNTQMSSCLVYASPDDVLIRPWLPPTFSHAPFAAPRQRVYLSATLGGGGELERAFGRADIARLPVPAGYDERGTGRRFFLFPELAQDFATAGANDVVHRRLDAFVANVIRRCGKAIVLTPSTRALAQTLSTRIPSGTPVVRAADVEDTLDPFTMQPAAVLALANRYDGIDLPDDACRLVVLDGLPLGADAQERFLAFSLGARRVLQERMRTRLVQGAGRATRNARDFAAVVVLGSELVAFCGRTDAQRATHPEVRAELEFGLSNSEGQPAARLLENLEHFLAQDEAWTGMAEPGIAQLRSQASEAVLDGDAEALAAAARHEVRAQQAAWRGEWQLALQRAEQVIDALSGGVELRPYQALWNHLAEAWATWTADETGEPTFRAQADRLAQAAHAAARGTTWLHRPRSVDGDQPPTPADERDVLDELAAQAIVTLAGTLGTQAAVSQLMTDVTDALADRSARRFEAGLVEARAATRRDQHTTRCPGACRCGVAVGRRTVDRMGGQERRAPGSSVVSNDRTTGQHPPSRRSSRSGLSHSGRKRNRDRQRPYTPSPEYCAARRAPLAPIRRYRGTTTRRRRGGGVERSTRSACVGRRPDTASADSATGIRCAPGVTVLAA